MLSQDFDLPVGVPIWWRGLEQFVNGLADLIAIIAVAFGRVGTAEEGSVYAATLLALEEELLLFGDHARITFDDLR